MPPGNGCGRATRVTFIVPAHNEETTLGRVVDACVAAAQRLQPSEVIAAIDCSTDGSVDVALARGVTVVERVEIRPSKADAMQRAVAQSSGDFLFFVDADLLGLTAEHLIEVAEPVLSGLALMGVGTFDYRAGGRLVQRVPWSTGQRILPREVFESVDRSRLQGYNIELLINEEIGRRNGLTASTRMRGVTQRSKARKHGRIRGIRANFSMWTEIAGSAYEIDRKSYRCFAENVVLADTQRNVGLQRQSPAIAAATALIMQGIAKSLTLAGTGGNSYSASK